MGRIRHKRTHHARRDISRAARTRARKLDQDQVHSNLFDESKRSALENPSDLDVDKAGLGAYYCIPCDRHFPSEEAREVHRKSKLHKRIEKKVREEEPYTQEEALRGAGVGIDNRQRGTQKKAIQEEEMEQDKTQQPQASASTRRASARISGQGVATA